MSAAKRFMKNDRVEFDMNSRTVHGVLVEDSDTFKVVADGGKMKFTVPFTRLRFSSKLLPMNAPHEMDAWQVSSFKELHEVGSETTAYAATITLNGAPVISVTNVGNGAPDRLAPLSGDYGIVLDFRTSVRDWLSDNGVAAGEIVDEESFWISYQARQAPFGVLVEEAIEEHLDLQGLTDEEPDSESESLLMR